MKAEVTMSARYSKPSFVTSHTLVATKATMDVEANRQTMHKSIATLVAKPGQPDATAYRLNNRIFFRLFQLANQLQRQAIQQLGISTVQWAVLGALSQPKFSDGIPLGELGEYLIVTRQNLDGVLKRLERDGLVRRVTADNDRRSRLVQMTPSGRRYWTETVERICEFYEQAAANFSFDDRIALIHYMNLLQKDLGKVKLELGALPQRRKSKSKKD
jgi:DNA-binding MarR family transcriptional regulator